MLLFIAEKPVLEKMNKLLDKWSMKKLKVEISVRIQEKERGLLHNKKPVSDWLI